MAAVEVIRQIKGNRGHQVLVRRGDEYFIVSSIEGETLVFHANSEGKPTSFREVRGASGRGLTRAEAIELLEKATGKTCEICGELGATPVIDPFLADVHEEEVERLLCPGCFDERKDDV
jgi:hypothetical protein